MVKIFDKLIGQTIVSILTDELSEIVFIAENGDQHIFNHWQRCCETVEIESIVGDLEDLFDSPITMAEVVCSDDCSDFKHQDTWHFYKFGTAKGFVTVRWVGYINYYSVEVDYEYISNKNLCLKMNLYI